MAMQPLIEIQQQMAEVGRIRLGDKGPKGEPRKITTFRLTSKNKTALDAAAALYGGTVRQWEGAPDPDTFELLTSVSELAVAIPPVANLCSQFYEMWAAGGCTRRCDGVTEMISGDACQCDPDDDPKKRCKVTTRISVAIPSLPGFGVWRLESHGWNAAKTLPGTIRALAGSGKFVPAIIRLEQRTEKKDGQTRRFVVPVIDLAGVTLGSFLSGVGQSLMLGGDVAPSNGRGKTDRPALPEPPTLPDENPSWEGRPPVAAAGDGVSKKAQAMLDSLDDVTRDKLATWEKNMKKVIEGLPQSEQLLVNDRMDQIRDLPF